MGVSAALEDALRRAVDETGFSGVVAVTAGSDGFEASWGFADRAARRPMTTGTALGTASVTKGFTAVAVLALVADGVFDLATRVVEVTDRLPMLDDDVTIAHLLGHTSGAGDYLDEDVLEDIEQPVLGVAPGTLLDAVDYLPLLTPHPHREPPGTTFRYNNSGYVALSVLVELVTGRSFHEVVRERVLEPAGMAASGMFRLDDLPAHAALGYLRDGSTNEAILPARGAGDGGLYASAADLLAFWRALDAGALLTPDAVEMAWSPPADDPGEGRYGLGFWLDGDETVALEGCDAGVSCHTGMRRDGGFAWAILSNTSRGAWPVADVIRGSRW